MYPIVTLHKKRSDTALYRHPWVFSGAVAQKDDSVEHGGLVTVKDDSGAILGTGTFSATSSIAVRFFSFADVDINEAWFTAAFRRCADQRAVLGYGPGTATTGYRLVFGEADGVPGVVVDRYGDTLVLQLSTAGADRLRATIVAALAAAFQPARIIERSDLSVRREEKLTDVVGVRFGTGEGEAAFTEHGISLIADVVQGQKTGFFLDYKDARRSIARFAAGRDCLNIFSYTGATGLALMKAGAMSVHNVDASEAALTQAARHAEMNDIAAEHFSTEKADAFQWLSERDKKNYGLVVMDPPALIKSKKDAEEGKKAYHFLNRGAMRLVEDGGIFATSSCSHFLPEEDLVFLLRRASVQNNVSLDILDIVRQSPDHPQSLYFPESAYLKTFICRVRRN